MDELEEHPVVACHACGRVRLLEDTYCVMPPAPFGHFSAVIATWSPYWVCREECALGEELLVEVYAVTHRAVVYTIIAAVLIVALLVLDQP